ncbi:hypothetical protein MMC20_006439 [Loxospora ochrophaea]|nr:hypothetical protein [Loxospora ochrophaea]
MAAEEPQVSSIQSRIAALNLGQVGRNPYATTAREPENPPSTQRRASEHLPSVSSSSTSNGIGNEPKGAYQNGVLPPPAITRTGQKPAPQPEPATPKLPRRPTAKPSPALPPRRPSDQLSRRDSMESVSSAISNISSISALSNNTAITSGSRTPSMDAGRVRAPAYDPSTLPPLPPKRSQQEKEKARIPLKATKSTPSVISTEAFPPPATPSLPPRTPAREGTNQGGRKLPPREPPPMPGRPTRSPMRSSTDSGINSVQNNATPSSAPPPVPLASRPDLSKILATKPKPQATALSSSCMKCRDFSAPDAHAAKFPRQSVPSLDWLAAQLVAPFSSLTDRARAIFTWLHHNIYYDVESFFNHCVKPSTPASTLASGLAVCEGYAGLFTAIATKAGLESLVISGHGKGFSFAPLAPGSPIPAEYSTHAWNAVKIDNGEWKLLDSCWGAGNVSGKGKPYNKDFTPKFFTMDNNEFGLRHFPSNKSHFFRTDGRDRISWEEYILGDQGGPLLRIFNICSAEGINETKFQPRYLKLPTDPSKHNGGGAPTVRFQFEKICEHWDPVRNGRGKPYVYFLAIHGLDGRQDDSVPFDSNGHFWWADVPARLLGAAGQTVTVFAVETVDGRSGRGLTRGDFEAAKGRKAMGFQGLCAWELC